MRHRQQWLLRLKETCEANGNRMVDQQALRLVFEQFWAAETHQQSLYDSMPTFKLNGGDAAAALVEDDAEGQSACAGSCGAVETGDSSQASCNTSSSS